MNQGLFAAHGAQSEQPSRYKPIWTDRFYNGLSTNRSPLRSPLSAYYADGYNMGRTDTLIDGINVEISPRLTLIRRPGCPAFTSTNASSSPNTFYSYKLPNGSIILLMDTPTGVYTFTTSSFTLLFTKLSGSVQSNFLGLGPNLYWADGTIARAYESATGTVRQMGMVCPTSNCNASPVLSSMSGSGLSLPGVTFAAGGYASTSINLTSPTQWSLEAWVAAPASGGGPIASFESAATGASGSVFYTVYLDSSNNLCLKVLDGSGATQTINTYVPFTDTQWHHVCVSFSFQPNINNIVPVNALSQQNSSPDAKVTTSSTYPATPSLSSSKAPNSLAIKFFIDGQPIGQFYPPILTLAAGTGYWRLGGATGQSGWSGKLSLVGVINTAVFSPADHWQKLSFVDAANPTSILNYQVRMNLSFYNYLWEMQEVAGTVMADALGLNTGTYISATLNQVQTVACVPYAATTAYTVGRVIVDSGFNLQRCITAGTSGGSAPTWSTGYFQVTTDGSAAWQNLGPAGVNATNGAYRYYYSYINAQGHYSSLSPISNPTGWGNGQAPNVIGLSPTDAQVSGVAIFRTVAGGSTPFFLDIIHHIAGPFTQWGYLDTKPDTALNILMPGPLAFSNDAPPYGIQGLAYHMNRTWGFVGNVLYASGGPDTIVGNGNEAWPPANSWNYPAQIVKLIPHNSGLVVLTRSGIFLHTGGPAVPQFYLQPLFDRVGVSSWNAVDSTQNEIFCFTTDRRVLEIDLSSGTVTDLGFQIQDKLALLDPSAVYVARHHTGIDDSLFIGDGAGSWYKCTPKQPPDYSITGAIWSTKAAVIPV